MKKIALFIALLSIIISTKTIANNRFSPCCCFQHAYLGVETGFSVSTKMLLQPDYNTPGSSSWIIFDHSIFDADMNTSPLVGGLVGYQFNPNFSTDLSYHYRNDYTWERTTTLDGVTGIDPGQQVGERYIAHDISVQTLLLGINLKPCVHWAVVPYVSAGIGAAWNRIAHLQNEDIPSASRGIPQTFNNILEGDTKTNFAWKLGAGIDYLIPNCERLHLNLNYRFVDVGTLRTGTRFYDAINNRAGTINPFKAEHVQLNEAIIGLTYHFA